MQISIHPILKSNKDWVKEVVQSWLADFIVSRGRKIYPADIDGFYAIDEAGNRVGMVTYEITDDQCEIVTLDAFQKFQGIGTALIEAVKKIARQKKCRRLWLITTNDNLEAIRFYQRRGFTLAAVHVNALSLSRKIKPSIPEVGNFGIPMRDEIEFEMSL
ncbi:MAG: GNAT family N-acetyltransferase [FCB group bacterium]|nr:GNAT family N-acetyltransferase [FCB group bacterium]